MRVHRYRQPAALGQGVANALVNHAALDQRTLRLCMSDGLGDVCAAISAAAAGNPKMRRLDLWWSNDCFVDVTDPARVSTRTLAALGTLRLAANHIHPMPTPSGNPDVDAAAIAYAAELGDTPFDLTILMVGDDGRVAGLKPGSPTFQRTTHRVLGVRDSQHERLTLSLHTLAASTEVWFVAIGEAVAPLLPQVLEGDDALPAGVLRGRQNTKMFVDEAAAAQLLRHICEL